MRESNSPQLYALCCRTVYRDSNLAKNFNLKYFFSFRSAIQCGVLHCRFFHSKFSKLTDVNKKTLFDYSFYFKKNIRHLFNFFQRLFSPLFYSNDEKGLPKNGTKHG